MNIDRSNYEVWFIDWLDGNLNSSQIKELFSFLDLNPDLKADFNDLQGVCVVSPENSYRYKNELKRSAEDISESQFEYLCAAYFEKDLSISQRTEIDEIIGSDSEKRRVFEQISKTHLAPVNINYKHKKQLLKLTSAQKIIRLSVLGLSAAAVISLILTTYLSVPENLQDNKTNEAVLIMPDNNINKQSGEKIPESDGSSGNKLAEAAKLKAKETTMLFNQQVTISATDLAENKEVDKTVINSNETVVEKIKDIEFNMLSHNTVSNDLASSYIIIPDVDSVQERSKIGKYIAKTFREKFLKEKTPPDSPLKAYEIAEAGVNGINKLFGWEMALDKKNDQNGNLKSVYFSSRIIKFNAPVKKSEPLP
jgi:hypothetical protein